MATKAEKLLAKGQALEKKGKLDKAIELFREACADAPYDPEMWTARADVAIRLKLTAEAADALFRVAELFARGGMPSEALKVVRRVLEVDKAHGGARRFQQMLEARLEPAERPAEPPAPAAPAPAAAAPAPAAAAAHRPGREVASAREQPGRVIEMIAPEPQVDDAPTPEIEDVRSIVIEADDRTMDIFAKPAPAPAVELAPTSVSSDDLPLAMTAKAGNGAVSPSGAAEFSVGATTGELALDSLSLSERLVKGSPSAATSDIPLDDEPRIDVVQAVASTLSTSPLLSELDSDLVKMLIDCGALVHRAAGVDVFKQGEPGTSLYLILHGEVAVLREEPGGRPRELARLRAGAFFGEMAVLTNSPRSATVRAHSNVDLLEISRRDLRAMIDREARVLKLIMRFFRARMVGTLLQTSPLFKLFDRDEKRKLVAAFRLRELGPGYEVLEEGTRTEGLFMVLAGRLEAIRGTTVLGLLGPGDMFGEMSLLDASPAMATVRAKLRSWVLILPRDDFALLSSRHPAIVDHLRQVAADRRERNKTLTTHREGDSLVPI